MTHVSPPAGPYVTIRRPETFIETLDSPGLLKYLQLEPGQVMAACDGIRVAQLTSVMLDCQNSDLDLRCAHYLNLPARTALHLYNCNVLLQPSSTFLDLAVDPALEGNDFMGTDSLLALHGGSLNFVCQSLSSYPEGQSIAALPPNAAAAVPQTNLTMAGGGTVLLDHVRADCQDISSSTTEQQFFGLLLRQAGVRVTGATLQIKGTLVLRNTTLWNHANAPVYGTTTLLGVTPFGETTIDFQRNADIMELHRVEQAGVEYDRLLRIKNLRLINLPPGPDVEASGRPREFTMSIFTSALWFAKAAEGNERWWRPMYSVEDSVAIVECDEVEFLAVYFQELSRRYDAGPTLSTTGQLELGEKPSFTVAEDYTAIMFHTLNSFGLRAHNYTVTCEGSESLIPLGYTWSYTLGEAFDDITLTVNNTENVYSDSAQARIDQMRAQQGGGSNNSTIIAAIVAPLAALVLLTTLLLLFTAWRHRSRAVAGASDLTRSDNGSTPATAQLSSEASVNLVVDAKRANSMMSPEAMHNTNGSAWPLSSKAEGGSASEASRNSSQVASADSKQSESQSKGCRSSSSAGQNGQNGSAPGLASRAARAAGAQGSTSMEDSVTVEAVLPVQDGPDLRDALRVTIRECKDVFENAHLDIEGVISASGTSAVYAGTWRGLEVAVKASAFIVPRRDIGFGRKHRKEQEARIAYSLSHANIVSTFAHEMSALDEDSCKFQELQCYKIYMIQEFCAGGSLCDFLRLGHMGSRKRPNFGRLLCILRDVAFGLAHMHDAGIVHGDLSPRKILLQVPPQARSGDHSGVPSAAQCAEWAATALESGTASAQITGFSCSIQLDRASEAAVSMELGKPEYAAPEVKVDRLLSRAADVYSFGVLMWQLFTLKTPGQSYSGSDDARSPFPGVSKRCPLNYSLLLKCCLSTAPRERPLMSEVCSVLEAISNEVSTGTYLDSNFEHRDASTLHRLKTDAGRQSEDAH